MILDFKGSLQYFSTVTQPVCDPLLSTLPFAMSQRALVPLSLVRDQARWTVLVLPSDIALFLSLPKGSYDELHF